MNTPAEDTHTHDTAATDHTPCEPCAFAAEHAWWGPSLAPARSHCRDCHRSWASHREGHCARCHRHFADVRAFDYHLTEDACTDPATALRADGRPRLVLKQRTFGGVWAVIDYRTHSRPYETTGSVTTGSAVTAAA